MLKTDILKDTIENGEVAIKDLFVLLQNIDPANPMAGSIGSENGFAKTLFAEPAFKIESNVLKVSGNITVAVGDEIHRYVDGDIITTPSMAVGTDYAIYSTADGLVVSSNFTTPDGYTSDNSRRIGGFHYQDEFINEHSLYDLKFRPACSDPRGMAIDISKSNTWTDIYMCNTTPDLLGTSAYNAQIADGSSCPKIPELLGGDGTSQYDDFNQYTAAEVLGVFGKRLPNYMEFQQLAKGSVTGHQAGADPIKTQFDEQSRSLIGCEQVSGHMWQWGIENWDRGNGSSGYAWYDADTNGQGQVSCAGAGGVGASLFGANWGGSGAVGSRASGWGDEPWDSSSSVGARGVCDHLQLM